jgi:competence protein ComEA
MQKIIEFLSGRWGQHLLLALSIAVLCGSLWQLLRLNALESSLLQTDEISIETSANVPESSQIMETVVDVEQLAVDIGGAVRNPGLYFLPVDSRLGDLVSAAGGFWAVAADAHALQKDLNLAEKLVDGQKYYIAFAGEKLQKSGTSGTNKGENTTENLISINQAAVSSLMTLTGVGEVRAQAIVDNRPYANLDELVSKKAITQKILDDNRDLLTL